MSGTRSGWLTPAGLTVVAAMLSVVNPGVLLLVPLGLLLLALPPRRPGLMVIAAFLLFVGLTGRSGDTLWWFGRGWALILGAWFVVILAVMPGERFVDRGLAAVIGALVTAAASFLLTRGNWQAFDWSVAKRLRDSASAAAAQFQPTLASKEWGPEALSAMTRAADLQAVIYPAQLALASLAALAVCWWLWRRLTVQESRPLQALREFRFRDELIWLTVVGIILIVSPVNADATRAGTNLATFMGALYALRGLGIMISLFGTPGPLGVALAVLVMLFLFPVVAGATVVLGLSDTWLDWRARASRNARPM
jgi:hypothetical protein